VLSGGSPILGSPFTGGGLSLPNAVALDGSGTAWVSNGNGSLSAFSSAGTAITPSTGYVTGAGLANGVAVDGSGSVWLTSCGSYCTGTGTDAGSVYQLIGVASPVVTPLAVAVKNGLLATKP
jgi:sugar lactone lactonase YvrE